MNQLELMRDTLIKATFSRGAVEAALQEPRKLRDDFAMAALPFYLLRFNYELAAKEAYKAADAALKARG